VAEVPAGVVTCTSTVPAASGGASTVSCVSLLTTTLSAGTPPKVTLVASVKPLPLTTTVVPPPLGPEVVFRPVTVGAAAAVWVNLSAEEVVEVPLGVVTVMSTVPAVPAGA
jgi:hypothetical protein